MPVPDPFTPNLKVDLLPEIRQPPRILSNYEAGLSTKLLQNIEGYLAARGSTALLDQIVIDLQVPKSDADPAADTKESSTATDSSDTATSASSSTSTSATAGDAVSFDSRAINALVLHVGIQAIAEAGRDAVAATKMTDCAHMDIFVGLARRLSPQGRYIFLNAMANQLRFPNSHTNYFSRTLLFLFVECADDTLVLEQITRVLLERLIVNRPHPWGLLITFIELVQHPRYNFWGYDFTVGDPEVRRLVESVARSCVGPSPLTGMAK